MLGWQVWLKSLLCEPVMQYRRQLIRKWLLKSFFPAKARVIHNSKAVSGIGNNGG